MVFRAWSESVWFSPCYVISALEQQVQKGIDIFDSRLKRYREAWVCAVSVICYSKDKPDEWWVQVPKNDPPDVLAMNIVPSRSSGGQDMSITKFEIFEINEFNNAEIGKQIETKLTNKDYSGMVLIGYLRKTGFFDFRKISQQIKQLNPKVVAICLVTFQGSLDNCSFFQLYPELGIVQADYRKHCQITSQKDFIEMSRGTKVKKEDNETLDFLTLIPK